MDKSRQCIVTQDRNYFGPGAVDQFDALVIDVRFFLNAKETLEMIPKKGQPFQRYVFHTHEVRAVQVSRQPFLFEPRSERVWAEGPDSRAEQGEIHKK